MPVLGVLPWLDDVWLDGEDTLQVGRWGLLPLRPGRQLQVAAIRFPRLSNVTDLDALAGEPGVEVTMTTDPVAVRCADLLVLPGSRSTVSDLDWLRRDRSGRCRHAGGAAGGSGARHLRWLSDAGRDGQRSGGIRSRTGCRSGAPAGAGGVSEPTRFCPHPSEVGADTRWSAARSTTALPLSAGTGWTRRSWRAAGSVGSGARCGTARSRATASVGLARVRHHGLRATVSGPPGSPRMPGAAGGDTGPPRRRRCRESGHRCPAAPDRGPGRRLNSAGTCRPCYSEGVTRSVYTGGYPIVRRVR